MCVFIFCFNQPISFDLDREKVANEKKMIQQSTSFSSDRPTLKLSASTETDTETETNAETMAETET